MGVPISSAPNHTKLTHCSDPFIHMERNNKTYGFTIAVKELKETVPNIFRYAAAYKRKHNLKSKGLWEMFVEKPEPKEEPEELPKEDPKYKKPLPEEILNTDPSSGALPEIDPESMEGETYNMCHFWSNFEIARLDWFRSKEYNDFFEMMDRSGGFWTERVSRLCLSYHLDSLLTMSSGETHQSTLSLLALFSALETFTTSATLATDIQRFSTVPRTRPHANSITFRTWR